MSQSNSSKRSIGVIGLGLMGTAITERLLEHGFKVHVWNRSQEKAKPLLLRGAVWSDNPLADSDQVIISLYSSDIVALVIEQLKSGLRRSQIIIDTTTGEPSEAIAMGQYLSSLGVQYLDAPISGSSQQTRDGEAMVMVGGEREAFESCSPVWKVLAKSVIYTGESGSASRMKLVTNLVLGLNRVALAEGLAFAKGIGVSPSAALEVLKQSAAYSRVMDVKGEKMIEGNFDVQARLSQHLKDVRIILQLAAAAQLDLPLSQLHRDLLERAEGAGLGEFDNSAIIGVYHGFASKYQTDSPRDS